VQRADRGLQVLAANVIGVDVDAVGRDRGQLPGDRGVMPSTFLTGVAAAASLGLINARGAVAATRRPAT
jgi:hypothetical protein